MRYNKILVSIFSALLLAVIVIFGIEEFQWDDTVSLSAVITSDGYSEEISCWEAATDEYILFLPSYAALSEVRFQTHTTDTVCIDGQEITRATTAGDFEMDSPYDLAYGIPNGDRHFKITFMKSGNMPTMYIDVPSGSMDFIHQEKGNEESGTLRLYGADGQLLHVGNMDSLSGRGNTTWDAEKKPYNLKLSAEADLLGMGQAQKWILLPNAGDASQLRNKTVYDFADAAGLAYSPQCRWVDLYLNGEYAGLYLLCERNEVHSQRVPFRGEGSFLVSLELEWRLQDQNYPYVSTASGMALRIHDSAVDENTLTQIWQSAENAILAEDGIDPVTGNSWTQLLDVDSWARKYLIEEVFGNWDAGALSQFFYCDGSEGTGKIYAGPVWDYDSAMGAQTWNIATDIFHANRPHIWSSKDTSWYYALYQKEEFYDRVKELYRTEFRPLLTQLLEKEIDGYAAEVSSAAAVNEIRWSIGDTTKDTERIRSYMTQRMAFLDSLWIDEDTYFLVSAALEGGGYLCYAVRSGQTLSTLPKYEPSKKILGWYNANTGEPFDIDQPIYEDTEIYLKENNAKNGNAASGGNQDSGGISLSTIVMIGPFLVFMLLLVILCFADRTRKKQEV